MHDVTDKLYEKKEKLEIVSRMLENKRKRLDLLEAKNEFHRKSARFSLESLDNLRHILTATVIDSENTIFSTEVKYKNALDESQRDVITKKIMKIISSL